MHSTHYISAWRRYGARGVLLNLLERICACVRIEVRHMTLLAHPLERVTPAEPLPAWQELSFADFERHQGDDPRWFTPSKMERLARAYRPPGSRAVGCVVDGRLVAYGWISEQYMGYSRLKLADGDGYLWDDYTHPDYRGQGWHGALIRIREQLLLQAGKQRALSVVARFNRASRRGFERIGYLPLEHYRFGRWWGRRFSTLRYAKEAV